MSTREARRALITEHAIITRPFLCPELELHLVTPACALWRATERDLEALGLPPPFWAFAWAGGQALARFVLDHPDRVADRRILDFGSGSALEGIAAMMRGARAVLAADLDPFAEDAAALNAALNGVTLDTTTRDLVGDLSERWDLVLVGDLFYDASVAAPIITWLEALAARGTEVWIGDPSRGPLDASGARLEALAVYDAPADVDVGGVMTKRTTVHRLVPR
ncbi:50S ribosomal protein L11 methyltransferase [Myxococcota bacterium]|nr:50S ribosomal protein L11 methyltransferase [Myxococcota bacterium]